MALRDYLAGEVAADFGDGLLTRREALRRLGMLGLGVTGAAALLAACGGDSGGSAPKNQAAATTTRPPASVAGDTGTTTPAEAGEAIRFAGPGTQLQGAFAAPSSPTGSVLVIHENRGLTAHFFDVVGRLSTAGYAALCVDLLSREGGTASMSDPAAPPAALAAAPVDRLLGDLRAGIDELLRRSPTHKVGAVGFCFGGGMVWELLNHGEARLAAAVPFYGPAPDHPDFTKAKAAVLAIYGALDAGVNATRPTAEAALTAAGLVHDTKVFDGAGHAFFNDTGTRYNEQAARQAYADLLAWFGKYLT